MDDALTLTIQRLRDVDDPLSLLGALVVRARAAIAVWAPDGRVVLDNARYRALVAGLRGPSVDPHALDLLACMGACAQRERAFAGEAAEIAPTWLAAAPGGGEPNSAQARLLIEGNLVPVRDGAGRVTSVAGVFRDLSDEAAYREREQHHHATQARLQTLIDNAPLVLVSMDKQARYTRLEGQRLRQMNVAAEALIGRSAFEVSADQPQVLEALRRALAGESVTVRGESRAGGVYESRIVPERDAAGEVVGLTAIAYDATEQEAAERALRASQEKLRAALTAGRLATLEIDFRDGSCQVSENACQMLGASREQLSTIESALALVHPDDLAKARGSLAHVREHGSSVPNIQYRIVRPDNGETVWLERRVQATRDAQGQVTGISGLLIDVTERKRAEEAAARAAELVQDNRRMAEASRLKSAFLANMSHELRTPLNAILGFTELLYDGHVAPGSPRFREFLGDILHSGEHLRRLINDVLDLAKVEAGKQEFRPEPVVLPELIAEVRSALEAIAQGKRIELKTELDPALRTVTLDPARFKQVLFNYLSNALKFTPDGGQVVVRTVSDDERSFRLEVEDTGIGISAHDLTRLFSEFQQLEVGANKRHQGTGLGLVLTRRLVEAQGGSVGVQSEPGRGSTFVAKLPRV